MLANKFTTDRNRTSPFAFVENRFEFRMPGSSASIAVCNTILNTAVAQKLSEIVDALENSKDFYADLKKILVDILKKHKRVVYNGNGYTKEWEKEALKRGLSNIKTAPEAFEAFTRKKSIDLLTRFNIYSEEELKSRYKIKMIKYLTILNIEAKTMLNIAKTQILPACLQYSNKLVEDIRNLKEQNIECDSEQKILEKIRRHINHMYDNIIVLGEQVEQGRKMEDKIKKTFFYKDNVIKTMQKVREHADKLERNIPKSAWPIPTYTDILFHN